MVTFLDALLLPSRTDRCAKEGRRCAEYNDAHCPLPLHAVYTTGVTMILKFLELKTTIKYQDFKKFKPQALFSFHPLSAAPQRALADGTWNCSVTHYDAFAEHLTCDLFRDCQGGEDERGCPYASPSCGAEQFLAGGGCFGVRQRNVAAMTWREAADTCSPLGGHLPVLSRPAEWRAVYARLRDKVFYSVYLGLSTVPHRLPSM